MTSERTDLNQLFQNARRGQGGAKMISKEDLLGLYKLAAENDFILDSVEPFKIEANLEIPYVDLTLYPSEIHESLSLLNWSERIVEMGRIIEIMLAETKKVGGEFRFNAWVSRKEDWLSKAGE